MSSFARTPLPKFEERLFSLCERKGRHVLHGEIALEQMCSLEQVTREMERLVASGSYQRLSVEDLRAIGADVRIIAYRLAR